jgi:hypothetical protein
MLKGLKRESSKINNQRYLPFKRERTTTATMPRPERRHALTHTTHAAAAHWKRSIPLPLLLLPPSLSDHHPLARHAHHLLLRRLLRVFVIIPGHHRPRVRGVRGEKGRWAALCKSRARGRAAGEPLLYPDDDNVARMGSAINMV